MFTILGLTELDLAGRHGRRRRATDTSARASRTTPARSERTVVVAELDPVRALAAVFDGYRVAPLLECRRDGGAGRLGDRSARHDQPPGPARLRPDAVVAVAGGVPQEVAIDDALAAGAVRETIGRKRERFTFPTGASVVILDDGGCINVTAGEGNPIEIMDLSFAVQLSAIRHLVESAGSLARRRASAARATRTMPLPRPP